MSMNLKIKPEVLLFIVLCVCIFVTVILGRTVVYPSIKAWQALKKEAALKEGELQHRYDTLKEIQKLKQDIPAIEKTYADFYKKFFPRGDISHAIKEIADTSSDLQIEFTSLTPLQAIKLGETSLGKNLSLWSIPISIKIKTDYAKLIDFIKRIENGRKFMKVENLSIRKNASTLLMHDIEMTVYVFSLQQ